MDMGGSNDEASGGFDTFGFGSPGKKKPILPDDLPKSLDDRRFVPTDLVQETEMYDGWQGQWCIRPPAAAQTTPDATRRSGAC